MCKHRGNWINFELLRIKYLFGLGNLHTKIRMTGTKKRVRKINFELFDLFCLICY